LLIYSLATSHIHRLSLHDALPICWGRATSASTRSTPAWSSRKERIARESWTAISARTPRPRRRSAASANRKTSRRPRFFSRHPRSEEHTSELQSPDHLVCRLLLEK